MACCLRFHVLLQYGTSSGSYSTVLLASQTNTYTANAICGTFASKYSYIDPGLFISANLTGLTPATKYYYRVGALVRLCCSSHLRRC